MLRGRMLIVFSSFSLSRLCVSVSEVMQMVLLVKYLVVNFEFQDVFFMKVGFLVQSEPTASDCGDNFICCCLDSSFTLVLYSA